MLAPTPSDWKWWFSRLPRLPMYDTSSIMLSLSWRWYVTDQFWKRGKVNPSGGTASTLVPLAKAGLMNGGRTMLVGRESIVQVEGRTDAVARVGRQRVCREAERRQANELVERHSGVIDPVAAADRLLLAKPIGKTHARAPGILVRVLELPRARATRTLSRKDQRARQAAGPRVRCGRIERRVLILCFRPAN